MTMNIDDAIFRVQELIETTAEPNLKKRYQLLLGWLINKKERSIGALKRSPSKDECYCLNCKHLDSFYCRSGSPRFYCKKLDREIMSPYGLCPYEGLFECSEYFKKLLNA